MKSRNTLFLVPFLLPIGCGPEETQNSDAGALYAKVARGALPIEVTESANIRAAKETRVKSEMEGKATIIWLIEEGKTVKKGDKLVELDASNQIERKASQEISVEKAKAAVVNAEKNLDILEKQCLSDLEAAENTLLFANMDLEKFEGKVLPDGRREMGEREQAIEAEQEQIKISKAELELARERYEASLRLRKDDFITENELERDKLDFESKKMRVRLNENRLNILEKYTHLKTRKELDQKIKDAKLEVERTTARNEAKLTQSRADLKSRKAELSLASERLANLEKQVNNAIVYAPAPGIVVYGWEGDWRRRRYVEIGASVRERQDLIILPDTSRMVADLRVHEAMVDKVEPGQRAQIEVDNSKRTLRGRVIRRAPLPDSTSRFGNPDLKVYKTEVAIDGNNADGVLRPGMSGTVKILIATLKDVLHMPLKAVRRDRAIAYVWKKTDTGPVAIKVNLGDANNTRIQVLDGLQENDTVYLAKPSGVQKPKFEQPKSEIEEEADTPTVVTRAKPKESTPAATGDNTGKPRNAAARRGRNRSGRGGGGRGGFKMPPEVDAFKAVLKANNPEAYAAYEKNPRSLRSNPAVKAAMAADPEIKAAYDKMMAAFRKMMGGRSRGGNRRGGGRPGGGRGRPGAGSER